MRKLAFLTAIAPLLFTGCLVGPNYKRPAPVMAPAFKEAPPEAFREAQAQGLMPATPADAFPKGKWWQIYNDPALNELEERVAVNNQNVKAAQANYEVAKALVRVARAGLLPTVGANTSASEAHANGGRAAAATSLGLSLGASWAPDLWGNIHRSITAAGENAQASFADLANATLLYQAEVATDYFEIHGLDSDADLLQRTAASYTDYLTLTRNRFAGGVASDLDVAQAESQLYGTQSALIDLGVARAQYEHAIAVLTGRPPAELMVAPQLLTTPPPPIPVGIPSELLQRRPDIAASERQVAAANENIGIAMAAFYPSLTLSASAGFTGPSLAKWFSLPSRFWSVGPALAETIFEGGRRRAVVAEEQAAYDVTVANYRQTALTAFQQVEDELSTLRILEQEEAKVQETISAADRALTVSTAQYKAGTTDYLTVITSQATLLNARRTSVDVLIRRLVSSVSLVQALGGGWDVSDLPSLGSLTGGS